MRLTPFQIDSIKKVIEDYDQNARIYLFGSRTDDTKKGGDIDLLVHSEKITDEMRRMIKIKLYDLIGEQKIDLIITSDLSKPFVQIALEQGIKL